MQYSDINAAAADANNRTADVYDCAADFDHKPAHGNFDTAYIND
jgi:hypothetical protein